MSENTDRWMLSAVIVSILMICLAFVLFSSVPTLYHPLPQQFEPGPGRCSEADEIYTNW